MSPRHSPKPLVSLIVSIHDQAGDLASLAMQIDNALNQEDYELILVDQQSNDASAQVVETLAADYPITLVRWDGTRGSALAAGLDRARGEVLGILNTDLQQAAQEIPRLLKTIRDGADIAVASRYVTGGCAGDSSKAHRALSKGTVLLVRLLLPSVRRLKDPLSGLFLFHKHVLEGIATGSVSRAIPLGALIGNREWDIREIPHVEARSEKSVAVRLRHRLGSLGQLLTLAARERELRRLLQFCIVGASGILVNEGLLWLLTSVGSFYLYPSSAIAIEASIINNFAWNDLWTFRDRRTGSMWTRLGKFHVVSISGLAINMGVLALLTELAGVDPLVSNLAGIALALAYRFSFNTIWTWRKPQPNKGPVGAG